MFQFNNLLGVSVNKRTLDMSLLKQSIGIVHDGLDQIGAIVIAHFVRHSVRHDAG